MLYPGNGNEIHQPAQVSQQINLVHELNQQNLSSSGLSSILDGVGGVGGLHSFPNAIYFYEDNSRNVQLNSVVCQKAVQLISRSNDVTFTATIRQAKGNTGALFAFTDGIHRVLEIQSSGRRRELRFQYRIQETVFSETFPIDLADDNWHKIAITISDIQLDLYVDCVHRFQRQIMPLDRSMMIERNLTLWLGQRGSHHFMYQGYLRDVLIVSSSNGFRAQCPNLEAACPTCGQFRTLKESISKLENTVKDLTEKLRAMEQRMATVESCDCVKGCRINATTTINDGTSWRQGCDNCTCSGGKVTCKKIKCENSCRGGQQQLQQDQCCPKCKKQCYQKGRGKLMQGEKFTEFNIRKFKCNQCVCDQDGKLNCREIAMEKCPKLNCPLEKRIQPHGECCMICEGTDFCAAGHQCHPNAECRNLRTNYTCIYIDECSTNRHKCHKNAYCVNTPGEYRCKCNDGYEGDGQICKPVCKHSCLNGGQCVAPNTCSCRKGYYGHRCEADIDECQLGLHHCPANSKCVNKPGWYHCECNHGYEANHDLTDLIAGHELGCQDIDECSNPSLNTCPDEGRCVNFDGGYRCECNRTMINDQVQSTESTSTTMTTTTTTIDSCQTCMVDGLLRENGQRWPHHTDQCSICQCLDGVARCEHRQCDCSSTNHIDSHCCPQCVRAKVCIHQEDRTRVFRSGQQWSYDCQTCECINGEIDCWNDCPPINCLNPIRSPGDCCARCEDDPCQSTSIHQPNATLAGCRHLGKEYRSGQIVSMAMDKCTSCRCQNGRLCCSYSLTSCTINNESNHKVIRSSGPLYNISSSSFLSNGDVRIYRNGPKYDQQHSTPFPSIQNHYIDRFFNNNGGHLNSHQNMVDYDPIDTDSQELSYSETNLKPSLKNTVEEHNVESDHNENVDWSHELASK
ncbi:hypothetical protein RDWZM_006979 [Blomia tropicalis]|uniref:Uncharacterized protein n=1 Tax=Blomia tropicalis TaxID=40697 RepID=A0A9Q0M8T7_BLOTA|nr:hypothetical protein RDWZM_006979 [Blomia tropicalis]